MKTNTKNKMKINNNNSFGGIIRMVHDQSGSYLVKCDRTPYHIDDTYPVMDELDENAVF